MKYLFILVAIFGTEASASYTGFDLYSRNEACMIATEKATYLTKHAALSKCSCAKYPLDAERNLGPFWKCSVTKVKAKPVVKNSCK